MQGMEAVGSSYTTTRHDGRDVKSSTPAAVATAASKVEDATATVTAASLPCTSPLFPAAGGAATVAQQVSQPSSMMMMMMVSSGSGEKKKRGRPKKYGPDGIPLPLSPTTASSSAKQAKARLLASLGEWFAYSAGGNFTPHVVTIATGEDVATKILSFAQKGPRAICVLSANGAISNATLRQPGSSGGTLTYEGRFEILSLSGSFTISEDSGVKSRTGGISVSLAGPDGRVIGGGVVGLLLAASPIQVVVGSFLPNTFKELKRKAPSEATCPPLSTPSMLTAAKPISQATPDDGCETPTSNFPVRGHGDADNRMDNENINYSSSYRTSGWDGFHSTEHRPSPDINICLQGE